MRIATFNILHGRSLDDGRVDVERLAAAVRDLDADVLALQEVDRDQHRSHLVDLTEVAGSAMGATAQRFAAAVSGTPGATWVAATGHEQPGTATYGIALLSRYPVRSWQVMRLPRIRIRFPMYLPGPRKILVVREEPRVAVAGIVDSPLGELTVANTHLSFVPGLNTVQLRRLHRDLAAMPGPLLLVGDLNMPGSRPARITGYRPLVEQATFPVGAPRVQLDHVLLRGTLPPVRDWSVRALPLSDHRAVVVDF